MSTETVKRCDVTSTRLQIKSYHVLLEEVTRLDSGGPNPNQAIETVAVIIADVVDLSPKAFKRLYKFIMRGTTAMNPRKRPKPPERETPQIGAGGPDAEAIKADMAKEAIEQIENGEQEGDFVDADEARKELAGPEPKPV